MVTTVLVGLGLLLVVVSATAFAAGSRSAVSNSCGDVGSCDTATHYETDGHAHLE